MTQEDIYLAVRENLNDEKVENWSEESLLDKIRLAYLEVSKELLIYQKSIFFTHDGSVNPLPLPRDLIQIIGVFLNDKQIDIKSFVWATRHREHLTCRHVAISNYDGLRILPTPSASSQVEVVYQFTQTIYGKDVVLDLPELAKNALIFYALYLANLKETRKESISKSTHYLELYNAEISKVKKDYFSFKNSKTYYQNYNKV
jgi:hypothetical protein